jgi:hypothetical protein
MGSRDLPGFAQGTQSTQRTNEENKRVGRRKRVLPLSALLPLSSLSFFCALRALYGLCAISLAVTSRNHRLAGLVDWQVRGLGLRIRKVLVLCGEEDPWLKMAPLSLAMTYPKGDFPFFRTAVVGRRPTARA